ncbi:helix-turn-helix domain-containing protein [Paraconexibacter algicola]|uniref:helix-turn-helix domain-containing protein n=1 Tax=Paraconexibacter algicola TaxID=2133960 RepID=UPI0013049DB8|nr:helix-turn-helix domain-containing protein [Paraconexibacter algicola]
MDPGAVQRAVECVAGALVAREGELEATMLARFGAQAPEAGTTTDPDVAVAMRASSRANLRAAIRHVVDGGPPLPHGAPVEALEEARTCAGAGIPVAPGLQTYRIGQAVVLDAVLDVLETLDDLDAATRSAALRRCTRRSFAYVDAIVPLVIDEYTRERDRLLRGREQRRAALVRDVLDGEPVDAGELGYDLAATHRAVIAWGPRAEAVLLALAAGLELRALTVTATATTVWGWFAGRAVADDRSLRAMAIPDGVGLAVGRPRAGADGFRASHREARAAQRIAAATGADVTFHDDVALEAVLLADESAARAFVEAELGALDGDRGGAKLRETLAAYAAAGFNASAAAATLGVNDRTVAYRLRTVEERLGRPVRSRLPELLAAIRVERVLGPPSG